MRGLGARRPPTGDDGPDRAPPTGLASRLRRAARAAVPLLQLTAAATIAWAIALWLGGHDDPFFAPIAAVVALTSPLGERGTNAVRLLLGVMIGIVAGELTILAIGSGDGKLPVATFAAMATARVLGRPRLVMVQAAAAAVLTIAAADGEAGVNRLVDAVIGAGVALLFSQVLLSPEPVRLVRRAAARALASMAEALTCTADGLEQEDHEAATAAVTRLRDLRDELAELARVRKASGRVARHSALWRAKVQPAVSESENAGHLDLLGASCLLLARTVAAGPVACAPLRGDVRRLADALREVAADPGDRAVRQSAADHALAVARSSAGPAPADDPVLAAARLAVHMVAVDVMVFAGVDADLAAAAARQHEGDLHVAAPPSTGRQPIISVRRPRPRRRP